MPDVDFVFFVTQVGSEGTPQRQRADDVMTGVLMPVVKEFGLEVRRADLETTPGPISPQMIRQLLQARVVIADLTDRNPNAYYELGVAQAFVRPCIVIVDEVGRLAFDMAGERAISIGGHGPVAFADIEPAKAAVRKFLATVLAEGYEVENTVTNAVVGLEVDRLSTSGNAIATEVAALRDSIESLQTSIGAQSKPKRDWSGAASTFGLAAIAFLAAAGMSPEQRDAMVATLKDESEILELAFPNLSAEERQQLLGNRWRELWTESIATPASLPPPKKKPGGSKTAT